MTEKELTDEQQVLFELFILNNGQRWGLNWHCETPLHKWNRVKTLRGHIIHLDLCSLGLRKLPSSIKKLHYLRTLNLSDNDLRKLPSGIGNLSDLQALDLSLNLFENLPDELLLLTKLEKLHISSNPLKDIPDLSKLPWLVELECSYMKKDLTVL